MIAVEHRKRGIEVAASASVIEFQAPFCKFRNIRSIEKHSLRIKRIDIGRKVLRGKAVIVATTGVMSLLYNLHELLKRGTLSLSWSEGIRWRDDHGRVAKTNTA